MTPSLAPTTIFPSIEHSNTSSTSVINITESFIQAEKAEAEHEFDAEAAFALNLTIIACLLLAYAVRRFRIYSLPESAGALLVGVVVGGCARLFLGDKLDLFEFSPEIFFFVLLPPIIFEAGYSLDRKGFFDNIGAITLYAMFGTIISTFVVGYICFFAAKIGLIKNIDSDNPMEALIFGSLISAVDPVATLSILGNEDLHVDPLLYSLVFGESVLNDAIAISLFKSFSQFYNPEKLNAADTSIATIIVSFVFVSGFSILVGVALGLGASWLFKHTELKQYPKLETSLVLCFCYLCYATAESIGLSGIMALFFNGVVLSHYNAYNLSLVAHVATEQVFSTFATLTETIVFIYMGMGVFTGGFQNWDPYFSVVAFVACLIGRAANIFPLTIVANLCREKSNKIPAKMSIVLWFAGLRGAIAFALSENMPGPNKDVYATATLTICVVTTVFCGGFTERMLVIFEMRELPTPQLHTDADDDNLNLDSLTYKPPVPRPNETQLLKQRKRLTDGIKGFWYRFDNRFLQPHFGGENTITRNREELESAHNFNHNTDREYELGNMNINGAEIKTQTEPATNKINCMEEEMTSLTSRQE